MRRFAALAGLLLAATACATPPEPEPPFPGSAPPASAADPAPPAQTPPQSPAPAQDACGAAGLQALVGRPRTEIPVPVDPNRQRVACTTCPVTMDFNPNRLNFFFDAQTGLIKEVRCG
jgi:hypothetical protein